MTTATALDFKLDETPTARDRTVTYVADVETLPDGRTRQLRLSVTHWPSSRCFGATLTRQLAEPARPGSVFSAVTYDPMSDMERIARKDVARYSAKALTAYAAEALSLAVERLAGDLGWMLGDGGHQ